MRGFTHLWVEFLFLCLEVQLAVLAVASVDELKHRLLEIAVKKVMTFLLQSNWLQFFNY